MDIVGLVLLAFVSSITPGPNNVMLWGSGMNFGIRRSIPHIAGVNLGFGALLFAISLGLGALFEAWPIMAAILKILGSAYLLYLAYRVVTSAGGAESRSTAKPLTFGEAAAFQPLNPKAWVMGISAVAAFLDTAQPLLIASLVLAGVFMAVNLPCIILWNGAGTAMGKLLTNSRRRAVVNGVLGALLVVTVLLLWA